MTRREMLLMLPMAAVTAYRVHGESKLPKVLVYKDPTCSCCGKWVAHLQHSGFETTATDVRDITSIKVRLQVPTQLRSCHTAVVGGYVVEGHVPAGDIHRLLKEHPNIAGLALPGMPTGSPGMEGPNGQSYVVVAFEASGRTAMYASHDPRASI